MVDVAFNSKLIKDKFSKWEDNEEPLAPLNGKERDSVIELMSVTLRKSYVTRYDSRANSYGNILDENVVASTKRKDSVPKNLKQFHGNIINEYDSENIVSYKSNDTKLDSCQQFLNWYANIEEGMEKEQDVFHQEYVFQLEEHRSECRILLQQLTEALENLQSLSDQYTSVSTKTSTLHTDCEHLLAEQTKLSNGADTIESKLAYFLEVNKISRKLSSPAFQVNSEGFIPLLGKIDECISYMISNATYNDSSIYLAKYRQCLNRALSMVKSYVTKSFEKALQQVLSQPGAENEKTNPNNAHILYYGKFRTSAPKIKILISEIEDRVDSSTEYLNLLNDCHQCYFAQRKILLEPCVLDALNQLKQKYARDYCSLIRSGCAFLVHVCEDEHNLYYQFFSLSSNELETFVHGLCAILYDALRPLIIHVDHLETLSELCNILRRGIIEEHIQNNPVQLVPLTYVVNQLLEDCQERLVYRAHIYIESDILHFNPSLGDLAYPSKLEMMESIAESLVKDEKSRQRDSVSSMISVRSSTSEEVASYMDERFSRIGSSPADLHGMWYPTVRRTLMCLSKVYRSVDRSIFQGVCSEALTACMASISAAASAISKSSSSLDAQLFEIKHLLILREQLAPFQIDSGLSEMSLDWSKLKSAALGLVQKRSRLFSLNYNNALLEFILEGTPQITEHLLDSKKDVDNHLKMVCEQLISTSTETLVSPLSSFLSKAEVILRLNAEKGNNSLVLKSQPFAAVDKVTEIITAAQRNLRTHIPVIQKKLHLYLANKDTEFILFKPIRTKVLALFNNVNKIMQENYTEEEQVISGFPSQEEISTLIYLHFKE